MKFVLILFLLICFIFISMTNSHAFRCGNQVVARGDSSASLLNKCGKPSSKEFVNEVIDGQLKYVEKWSYNCGSNDFLYKLTILNSTVIKDDPFERGTGISECKSTH